MPTSAHPPEAPSLASPLVGRDRELQLLLHDLYAVIEDGEPRLTTLVGAPGIGKSRLALELGAVIARQPEPVAVVSLQADSQSAAQPYSLLRRLVAALFGLRAGDPPRAARLSIEQGVVALLGPDSAEAAHHIAQLAGLDLADGLYLRGGAANPRQLRDQALHHAARYLAALTTQVPLTLILDDCHDADDSSLEAIIQMLSAGRPMAVLVVCLARPRHYERRPDWPGRRIDLGPLDDPEARRLVHAILHKAARLPASLQALIVSRAGGNPFYVEELIKTLIVDGVIVPGPASWQIRAGRLARLRIPATLTDLLEARLAGLGPAERELLVCAAVVGRVFWAEAALELCGVTREHGGGEVAPPLGSLLARLEDDELVAPLPESRFPGRREYTFRHELLHEVAYGQLSPELRQAYHRQVAGWLIANSDPHVDAYAGLIAGHFERGGRPLAAAEWAVRAGAHARDTYAVEAALGHFRAALALLPNDEASLAARIACYEGLGATQLAIARLGDAVASYTRMAELADHTGDRAAAARAWNGLAYVQDYSLDYRAAEASARRALALAEAADDGRQLILALYHVAWAELRNEHAREALALGQRALAVMPHLDDPMALARCEGVIGVAHEQLGNYEAARHHLQAALRYNREVGDLPQVASLLNNLGFVANMQGDYGAALAFLEEGLRVAQASRARINEIFLLTNLAHTLNGLGDYARAEAEAARGVALCETSRITAYADFYCALAEACLGQGRATEAVEAAQQALATARATEGPREVAAACRALGMAIAALSDPQGARPCFEESVRLFAEAGATAEQARALRTWAYYELRSGDPDRGLSLYRQARAAFAELGLRHELARTPETPRATRPEAQI